MIWEWLKQAPSLYGVLHTLNGMLLKSDKQTGVADFVSSASPCCITEKKRRSNFFSCVDIFYSWHSNTQKCDRILEKRINRALRFNPALDSDSESTLIRGKYCVHTRKWALVIARFYAQFKFKSFLLDTANTSVMRLPVFFFFFLLNN